MCSGLILAPAVMRLVQCLLKIKHGKSISWNGDSIHGNAMGTFSDSAEYLAVLLERFSPPRLDMSWEKRVMVGPRSDTLERNESRVPVFLRLGESPTSLPELLDCWNADENAVAAFSSASEYKVLQLDRVSYDDQGTMHKLSTTLALEERVHLPVSIDDERRCM